MRVASSGPDSAAPLRRWRDEPRRFVVGLVVILACTAVLMAWNLGRTTDFEFYGSAVRSMSESWRAFAFGAYDPDATVTLDKLSGFLLPQALSARVFGFSWSSIAAPQVIEGLITVWSCATVALRLLGARAGLTAAGAAATTPVFVSMFGRPMEDGLLTMCLAVALLFWQRGVVTSAVWPLALAGVFVGLGFQAKMLQAWLILPALGLGLLPVVPRWRPLLLRAVALGAPALVVSLAWMTAMQLVPAGQRPWFDGSVHNDVFSTVFVYNGLDRLVPPHIPNAGGSPLTIDTGRLLHSLALSGAIPQQTSPVKLLLPYYTTQVGWLYPLAIAGLVLGAARWMRSRRTADRAGRAVFAAIAVWLVTAAAVLSRSALAHTAYVAAIGVQLALLAAIAVEEGLRLLTAGGRWTRLVLPLIAVVEGAWSAALGLPRWLPAPLGVLFLLLVVAGLAAVVLVRREGAPSVWRGIAITAVSAGLLGGALTWSLQGLDPSRAGTGGDAYVGAKAAIAGTSTARPAAWHPEGPRFRGGEPLTEQPLAAIAARTAAGRSASEARDPLFAADSERISSLVLLGTGREVLTDGGYSGGIPVLTTHRLASLVRAGSLRWLVTFLHPPRADAVDRFARTPDCALVETWRPRPDSRVLDHGLALWHCGPRSSSAAQLG